MVFFFPQVARLIAVLLFRGKSNQVTFTDVATMGLFGEGSPPEFNCMNEYYGMTFERGPAVATSAYGTLSQPEKVTDKVFNLLQKR